jgi:SnoaL-like protein
MPNDFDQIAIVVDWLDACRRRDLDALLDLYAPEASMECRCGGATVNEGRAHLASYWGPRLGAFAPNAFGLEEIEPTPDGVQLDYVSHEGLPVRMVFRFTGEGKILRTHCAPSAEPVGQDIPIFQGQAG